MLEVTADSVQGRRERLQALQLLAYLLTNVQKFERLRCLWPFPIRLWTVDLRRHLHVQELADLEPPDALLP